MKPKVYLETSFIGYLTSWPARDIVVLAHQQLTREWWETRRASFELFTSEVVVAEAERGDEAAVRTRRDVLAGINRLAASDPIVEETRKAREEVVAPFGENIHEFFEYLRKRERQSDRAAVTLQPNAPEPTAQQATSR